MIRRLIRLRQELILVSPSDKEDHRHADTFGWHRSQQDCVPSRVALGAADKVLVRKKFTRKQLLAYTANMQNSLNRLGGLLRRSLPRPFVKPFVKSNKNDFVDAEGSPGRPFDL